MFPLLRCLLMPSPSLLLAPLNFKSAFSLQRIFRCQIFPCEDWQFGVLVFAVLFAWEMAWDSPIVNIVLQTMKRQLFVNTLGIDGNSKSLSVECCLETKMRRDVKLLNDVMADTIGYIQWELRVCSSLGPTRDSRTARTRRDYKFTSLGASRGVNKLQLVQNSAARLLTGTRKHEHISPILRSLPWLPIPERIDFKLLLLTFKSLNDVAPPYMEELFIRYRPTRTLAALCR